MKDGTIIVDGTAGLEVGIGQVRRERLMESPHQRFARRIPGRAPERQVHGGKRLPQRLEAFTHTPARRDQVIGTNQQFCQVDGFFR